MYNHVFSAITLLQTDRHKLPVLLHHRCVLPGILAEQGSATSFDRSNSTTAFHPRSSQTPKHRLGRQDVETGDHPDTTSRAQYRGDGQKGRRQPYMITPLPTTGPAQFRVGDEHADRLRRYG